MNDYIEVRLDLEPFPGTDATDLLAGLLGDAGFESFVPDDRGLTAYCAEKIFERNALDEALADFPYPCRINVTTTRVEGRDWNEEWEKNYFQPIVIGDRCVVHSSFHRDVPAARYDIVIDPKMAFGTGHHATTSLILEQLLDMELEGKSLIDMGTGTAILAILAALRGASPVTGIEIDPFAHANAIENVALNGHPEIKLILGDASALSEVKAADVFLANINRNVITADLPAYVRAVRKGGTVILSGFYIEDVEVVRPVAESLGLVLHDVTEDNRWACMKLERNI